MLVTPVRLAPDNFTPATRTPWGGTGIVPRYKPFLLEAGVPAETVVGEAWELSATPEFPSRTEAGDRLLDRIAADPAAWLGREQPRGGTALLMKWLDAADNLSLQIHPRDDYARLQADEAGKPECWYIVEAQPGAGLYLGLNPGVDRDAMESALERGDGSAAELLRFVSVSPGDFFLLDPGMPHAIGRGVMLLEPQFVQPGRKGVTYRYWDWDRRYDAVGRLSPEGQRRPLHVQDALAVTDFASATDPKHLARRQSRAGSAAVAEPPRWLALSGPTAEAAVSSPHLQVSRVAGTGGTRLPEWPALRGLTVICGEIDLGPLTLRGGQTAAIPACAGPAPMQLRGAHALLAATP